MLSRPMRPHEGFPVRERYGFFMLLLIMVAVSFSTAGTAILVLYRAAMGEERARLQETAQSQARVIEAVARFDRRHQARWHPDQGVPSQATLSQIRDAHRHYEGFGRTGEFTLATRQGDRIVFLLRHRHGELDSPETVPFDSNLAEPMRRALNGRSGTLVGLDYRGEVVLAAHEPVKLLDYGIVAKIDLVEVHEPFVRAGWIAGAASLLLVAGGATLFMRFTRPILRTLQERAEGLEKANAALTREIEERVRAEERFRATFEQAAVGIAHVAPEGRLLRINRRFCEIIGYDHEEALQLTFQEITHEPDLEEDLANLRLLLAGEIPMYRMEKRYIRKGGSKIWVYLTVSLVRTVEGDADYLIGVVEDISEKKAAEIALRETMQSLQASEAQLIQAEKASAVGTMVAGVAHELNNPLTAMLQFVQYARGHAPEGDRTGSVLEDLERETRRCIGIVDNLLAFSRSRAEEEGLAEESLPELFERVEALQAYRFRDQGVRVLKTIPTVFPLVEVHPGQMEQVFLNLVANALDALESTEAPEIEVTMEAEGNLARISIADNGPGIPSRDRSRVLDPFFTTKPAGKGTGLGLSVSRGIVESHGGALTFEDRPGGGTVFRVTLLLQRNGR